MKDYKKLKRTAAYCLFMMILIMVSATTSTYAWFTYNASTNVEPIHGTISDGYGNLTISNSPDGEFDTTCELILQGNPEILTPISTTDMTKFYASSLQNSEGIIVRYKDVTEHVNEMALHGTVYLRCENDSCDIYFDPGMINFGTDNQALAAMRLAMVITTTEGTSSYIFKLDSMGDTTSATSKKTTANENVLVSAIASDGVPTYVTDFSVDINSYCAVIDDQRPELPQAGANMLCTIAENETISVEYWLYAEGCDLQCINELQARTDIGLQLGFAGVMARDRES